jgi:hypothetical protein
VIDNLCECGPRYKSRRGWVQPTSYGRSRGSDRISAGGHR